MQTFNQFELEPHAECDYDRISVYDGSNESALSKGRYCGSKVPDPIIASANELFIAFYSDASVQRKGFHATHNTG